MATLNEIREELNEYASSSDLSGTAIDALCSLLAFSIYKNQMVQTKAALDSSFSTSTNLNARIHHAANLLYSVPRGSCPYISLNYTTALETQEVEELEYCTLYNGYYLYFKNAYSYAQGDSVEGIELICAASKLQTLTTSVLTSSLYFVDFYDENISEDLTLYELDSGDYTQVTYTSDVNDFYQLDEDDNTKYVYDYLVITIPEYGIRIMRHADSSGWNSAQLEVRYIPYTETVPDFSSLKSIPGHTFVFDAAGDMQTEITVHGYVSRLEDLETIYARAIDSYHAQGAVATITDLRTLLYSIDPNAAFAILVDEEISTNADGTYYSISNPLVTTVVYAGSDYSTSDYLLQINAWSTSLSVTRDIQIMQAVAKSCEYETIYARAYSSTTTLTNQQLSSLTSSYELMIGEELDHSQVEADIVRLGYTWVKLYTDATLTTEWVGSIEVESWEYPEINIIVGG